MPDRINLADPAFEPTDEQLVELSRGAFAHVAERRRAALARVHADVAKRREEALRDVQQRLAGRKDA